MSFLHSNFKCVVLSKIWCKIVKLSAVGEKVELIYHNIREGFNNNLGKKFWKIPNPLSPPVQDFLARKYIFYLFCFFFFGIFDLFSNGQPTLLLGLLGVQNSGSSLTPLPLQENPELLHRFCQTPPFNRRLTYSEIQLGASLKLHRCTCSFTCPVSTPVIYISSIASAFAEAAALLTFSIIPSAI